MNLDCTLNFTVNNNDISLPITLSEEQLNEIKSALGPAADVFNELSGWESPKIGQTAYYEDSFNHVSSFEITAKTLPKAFELYNNNNFFTTEETARNTIRADNIVRKLRRYAIKHRRSNVRMANGGYTITYNYKSNSLEIGATGNWLALGDIVFDTEEAARDAMTKYAKELIWYFTSFKTNM